MPSVDQFLGEIRFFPYTFAPLDWADCAGQLMSIQQNTALFSLLGTTYGGDGRATFALPNLNGALPIGFGGGPGLTNRVLGETGGAESVILTGAELPQHTHQIQGFASAATDNNVGPTRELAQPRAGAIYGATGGAVAMAADTLPAVGGGQAHTNMQPYMTGRYCIALTGIFPPRS